MIKTASQLLYDLINIRIKSDDKKEFEDILNDLKNITLQNFEDDIDKWVEWFVSEDFENHEKYFIKTAHRIYKVNRKLKKNK